MNLRTASIGFGHCPTRLFPRTRSVWVAASPHSGDVVKVSFRCGPKPVDFGQQLAVISGLSDWSANDKAVILNWNDGDEWTGDCTMPAEDVEFKLASVARQDDSSIEIIEWEQCDNKVAHLSEEVDAWSIRCSWDSSEIELEQVGKKKKRKRAPKKHEQQDSPVIQKAPQEDISPPPEPEPEPEPVPRQAYEQAETVQQHTDDTVSSTGKDDMVVYNFDGDNTESAADMAKRILG